MNDVSSWHKSRLKYLFTDVRNGLWGDDAKGSDDDVYCVRGTDFDRTSLKVSRSKLPLRSADARAVRQNLLQAGDLILEKSGGSADQPVGSVALFDLPLRAVCSNFNARLQVASNNDARYVAYFMNSLYTTGATRRFVKQTTGIQNLDSDALLSVECLMPERDEQRRIADFLDAETERLDQLSKARSKQAVSLSELELSLIGSCLSGSDCPGERFQTGWPWMPSLPAEWRIGPVYAYYSVQLGKMLNPDSAGGEHQRSYLRNANVHWFSIDTSDIATMSFAPEERERFSLREGDLVVCEGGAGVAEAAIWDGQIENCYYQKSLHRVRCTGYLPAEWLMYWLRFSKASGVFDADGNIATIPHLTGEQFREYRIPIPPDAERRVEQLSIAITNIRATQEALTNGTSLLAKRRQALITAAVTGQIDVTTARGADLS